MHFLCQQSEQIFKSKNKKKQKNQNENGNGNTRNSNSLNFIGEIDKVTAAKSKAIANASRSIREEEHDGAAGRDGSGSKVGWVGSSAKQSTCTSTGIFKYMYLSFSDVCLSLDLCNR